MDSSRLSEAGFGMIEVIIASALMIVVGLGIASMITNMGNDQRRIMEYSEQKTYSLTLRTAALNPIVLSKTAATAPTGPN
jgi:Tfp pilus assembly protein PilV